MKDNSERKFIEWCENQGISEDEVNYEMSDEDYMQLWKDYLADKGKENSEYDI